MDYSKAFLVVFVTILIVIVINAAIFASVTRKNSVGQIELLRKAASRAKDPWQPENENLSELSRLVKNLQEKKPESEEHPSVEDQENA